MLRQAVIHITALALALPACANAQQDNAKVLAENMPAMELRNDTRISSAYKPYLDCYSRTIESGSGANLSNDAEVREVSLRAEMQCARAKQAGTDLAITYLTAAQPQLSDAERNSLLAHYRRQQGVFALMERYRNRGRSQLLQAYFERIGRAERQHKSFVMLSAQ